MWNRLRRAVHNRIYGTDIFLRSIKKVWQVYAMDYIGKSYVTTVYKCDDENNDTFFFWNNFNICRQCILKEKTEFQFETNWDELWTIEYKCDDEKNDSFFIWNSCNICRQCILKEKTEFKC